MNKRIMAFFAVTIVAILTVNIPVHSGEEKTTAPAAESGNWWDHWMYDRDHNGIDDRIDNMLKSGEKGNAAIFIDYREHPGERKIQTLKELGVSVDYVTHHINTVISYDAPLRLIPLIRALPGVVMVEKQPKIVPFLDVSVPSLKVRPNDVYPDNVWEGLGYTGKGMNIAILDSGVDDNTHESLDDMDDNIATYDPKFIAGFDAFNPLLSDGHNNPRDNGVGHGTHVAGIALGTGGSSHQYEGVAPGARLVDVKIISDAGMGGVLITGIDWCIDHKDTDWGNDGPGNNGIQVMSMSVGTQGGSDGQDATSREAQAAVDAGIVVVVAMGNNGAHEVPSPAAADGVIAVGATDDKGTIDRSDDVIASYSNYGPRQDDNDSDSRDELKPEISAPGSQITSAMRDTWNAYIAMDGTSMATPHVAGVAALMLQANPNLTPADVKRIIEDTAEHRGNASAPNIDTRWNDHYGYGILDGFAAVLTAEGGTPPPQNTTIKINITTPASGENVSGDVRIAGEVHATANIEGVQVRVDNREWNNATGDLSWYYYLDTTKLENGNHTVRARVLTDQGNATDAIIIRVNNTHPGGNSSESSSSFYGLDATILGIGAVIVVVAVLAIVLVVVKKKGKGKREGEDEQGESEQLE